MPMVINTNIMSINAQNNLRTSQGDMNSAMERLSSGKRVNSAADDAAGLAIINRFTSQERGLNMAIRNANDGISMIQTAEGALDETTNILQRMRELSIQSANGIYSDANRATLQAEVTQLQAELTRIAETTSFNGLKILDGTLGDLELQVGAESGERITVNLGDGFTAEALGQSGVIESSGSYSLSQSIAAGLSGTAGSLNTLDIGELKLNGVEIPSSGQFDAVSTSDAGASALGVAEAINSVSGETGVTATATNVLTLGDVTVSNWATLGTMALADADNTGANAAEIVGGATVTDLFTDGVDVTDGSYNFSVTIGDVTKDINISAADNTDTPATLTSGTLNFTNLDGLSAPATFALTLNGVSSGVINLTKVGGTTALDGSNGFTDATLFAAALQEDIRAVGTVGAQDFSTVTVTVDPENSNKIVITDATAVGDASTISFTGLSGFDELKLDAAGGAVVQNGQELSTGTQVAAEIKQQMDSAFSGNFTVAWSGTANGTFTITDTGGTALAGESMVITETGTSSANLKLLTGVGSNTPATDADNTLTIAAGELLINGYDMAGTYATNDYDLFVSQLQAAYNTADPAGAGSDNLIFDNDGSTLYVQSRDGGNVNVAWSGATTAAGDNFNITNGGTAYGDGTDLALSVSAGEVTLGTGELVINGKDFDGGTFSSAEELASLITSEASTTGVTAAVVDGALVLTAGDGRNIRVESVGNVTAATEANATTGFGPGFTIDGEVDFSGAAFDTVFTGDVTLNGTNIEISGTDTFGFTTSETVAALEATAGTNASMTLEVSSTATASTGTFDLNGTTISYVTGATGNLAGTTTSVDNLIAAINAQTEITGVSASLGSAYAATDTEVVLTAATGVGIRLEAADLGDTTTDVVNISSVSDNDSFGALNDIFDQGAGGTPAAPTDVSVADINTDGTFENMINNDLLINGYTVDFDGTTVNSETERSLVDGEASAMFVAAAINNTADLNDEVTATALTVANLGTVKTGTADAEFGLAINGTVVNLSADVLADDSNGAVAAALNLAFAEAKATDEFGDAADLVASVNTDGELLITAEDGRNITISWAGSNASELFSNLDLTAAGSVTAKGTIALEAKDGFTIGEIGGAKSYLAGIADEGGATIADIDISTQQGAQDALEVVDRALDYIADARGDLGAASNRLEFTINNLSNVVENAASARSRVQDADFAVESAQLARAQVLQQAGTAMLAQANAAPQQVLSLLQ